MNKTWLITKREYRTRVRNRAFLLSTFLFPLVIVLFIAGMVIVAINGKSKHRVAVVDANGYFKDYLKGDADLQFDFAPGIDTLNYAEHGCVAVLIIPPLSEGHVTAYRLKYKKQLGLQASSDLENRINDAITNHMIFEKTGINKEKLDSIRMSSHIAEIHSYDDQGGNGRAANQGLAYGVGYASGFLIYLLTFIYGAAVMRGVMEEKTSRIAEVIVSSVRPFQLMMGKIVGVGAVGLTQFLLWIALVLTLTTVAQGLIPRDTWKEVQQIQQTSGMGGGSTVKASEAAQEIYKVKSTIDTANWGLILFCFLFYFLGGYLFYSALFAAVGSVVGDDPQQAQSLMLPITMPVVFSFIIMSVAIQDPSGKLATWASIIPFSSPIVMMARIPFGLPGAVPWWQLGASMALLILGFLFTVWMAGKIYRTGILMYGKKVNWKTMWKWAMKA